MKLLPLDNPALLELAEGWLGDEENWKWLDFGNGVQRVTPVSLKVMTQRDIHCLRAYTKDDDDTPIGVVGLTNIDRRFKTASLWCVLGVKRHGGHTTTRAVSKMLTLAFTELGLEAVTAWTVECNTPARRQLERLPFKYVGRLRRCHWIAGRPYDRLLYDVLASEHREV